MGKDLDRRMTKFIREEFPKGPKVKRKPAPVQFVCCLECDHEQADMGTDVACEECGARMPEGQP